MLRESHFQMFVLFPFVKVFAVVFHLFRVTTAERSHQHSFILVQALHMILFLKNHPIYPGLGPALIVKPSEFGSDPCLGLEPGPPQWAYMKKKGWGFQALLLDEKKDRSLTRLLWTKITHKCLLNESMLVVSYCSTF